LESNEGSHATNHVLNSIDDLLIELEKHKDGNSQKFNLKLEDKRNLAVNVTESFDFDWYDEWLRLMMCWFFTCAKLDTRKYNKHDIMHLSFDLLDVFQEVWNHCCSSNF
jgi:hypothetical protein